MKPGEPYNLCAQCSSKLLDSWKFWTQIKRTQSILDTVIKYDDGIIENAIENFSYQQQENTQQNGCEPILGDDTRDILAYLADDLNISEECRNIDTLPPLHLDLDLDALIAQEPFPKYESSPKKLICPFSPTKRYFLLQTG